jgi:hypothetical protein
MLMVGAGQPDAEMMDEKSITLRLTQAEALILFEWLARHDALDTFPSDDAAEEQVFLRIHGQLESTLSEPFQANYKELLADARQTILREK